MAKSTEATPNTPDLEIESLEQVLADPQGTSNFLNKYKNVIIGLVGAVLGTFAVWSGYNYYMASLDEEAQKEMFRAVFYFENDSLQLALAGNGPAKGFEYIIDEYGGTKAGNLARFYAGTAYLRLGQFEKAAETLEDFKGGDLLVTARAYSLTGDAYMELKQYDKAVDWYKKAVSWQPNKFFTPAYLMKLGLAQELAGNVDGAIAVYSEIANNYSDQSEASDAKKFRARLAPDRDFE